AVTEYFTYWRNLELGDRRILEGLVAPGHAAPSPALERRIAEWDGYHYWQEAPEGRWLVLVSEASRPGERWWLHAALLLITLGTMTIGGAVLAGVTGVWFHPSLAELRAGIPFSLPLLAILLAHESGHYVAARYYRVNTSPPFFIPFPAQWNIIGTMGSFIRIRSPVFDRRTLFDIGVAGPIAGLVVAIPVLLIGLALSTPAPRGPVMPLAGQYIPYADGVLFIGNSLLLSGCRLVLGLHGPLHLHPVAIAGWVCSSRRSICCRWRSSTAGTSRSRCSGAPRPGSRACSGCCSSRSATSGGTAGGCGPCWVCSSGGGGSRTPSCWPRNASWMGDDRLSGGWRWRSSWRPSCRYPGCRCSDGHSGNAGQKWQKWGQRLRSL